MTHLENLGVSLPQSQGILVKDEIRHRPYSQDRERDYQEVLKGPLNIPL